MASTGKGWWAAEDASKEVLRAIEQLSSQEHRSSTSDMEANRELISQDSLRQVETSAYVTGIEYIDESSVGIQEFASRFVAPGRPCMIQGCAEKWPASNKWASASALVQSHGDVEVRVTELFSLPRSYFPSAKASPVRIPLKHYCAYAESNIADFPWYGFDDNFTSGGREALLEDFNTPSYFIEDCYNVSEEARSLFPKNMFFIVGGARTGTGLHVDPGCTSAWNTLLCGRKRWVLFPPGCEDEYKEFLGVQEEYSRKTSQPCEWWRQDYKRIMSQLDNNGSFKGIVECIQEAGDTIFVPAGWWHAVLNLDFTVAITANPLPPASMHSVWQRFSEECPNRDVLYRFATQCASFWPQILIPEGEKAAGSSVWERLLALADEEDGEEEQEFVQMRLWRDSVGKQQVGGVLFFDIDGCLMATGPKGGLREESVVALRELVLATGAEVVPTSRSRSCEVSRMAMQDGLNRRGVYFTRWITISELPGGRSSQILDFVVKNVQDQNWVVIDSHGVGQATGLMMEMLLHSRSIIAPEFTKKHALEAAKILFDIDDEESNENN